MAAYHQLKVWQVASELSISIYKLTAQFPKSEQFSIGDQMRRSGVSIPSNIAEGSRRLHRGEKRQFYAITFASASELETQILISKRTKLAPEIAYPAIEDQMDHTLRLLNLLLQKFR